MDLPSPSPFAFGLFATGRRDTLQLADTADFLLAMYEQVQRRLKSAVAPESVGLFFVIVRGRKGFRQPFAWAWSAESWFGSGL